MKLGWVKRFLKSSSDKTILPIYFGLDGFLKYSPDSVNRIEEMTDNTLKATKYQKKSNFGMLSLVQPHLQFKEGLAREGDSRNLRSN